MPCLCLLNEKHSEIETDLLFNAVNPLRQKRNKKMMKEAPEEKKFGPFLDLCVSSLRRGHANLLCIVPILSDVSEETKASSLAFYLYNNFSLQLCDVGLVPFQLLTSRV